MEAPKVWISNDNPAPGEVVRIRTQLAHRMESGLRLDIWGRLIAQDLLTGFTARLADDLLLEWRPGMGVSQNPYLEFCLVARQSGVLHLEWRGDGGLVVTARRQITVKT